MVPPSYDIVYFRNYVFQNFARGCVVSGQLTKLGEIALRILREL